MQRLKRYTLPIILATLALISLVAGILAVTVWKPTQEVSAELNSELPFAMTRPGVLSLYGPYQESPEVHVEATAPGDEIVWLALGKGDDVSAWLTDETYDEVIGLENLETLKAVAHEGTETAQSEVAAAEPEVAEEPQSGVDPLASNPIDSDMWTALKYGRHQVSMTLSGEELDQVLLAATNGTDPAPTIRLTWQTPQSNTLALIAFSLAGVFAFLALGTFAALYRLRPTGTQDPDELENLYSGHDHAAVVESPAESDDSHREEAAAAAGATAVAAGTAAAKKPRKRAAKSTRTTKAAKDRVEAEGQESSVPEAVSDIDFQLEAEKEDAKKEAPKTARKPRRKSVVAAEAEVEATEESEVAADEIAGDQTEVADEEVAQAEPAKKRTPRKRASAAKAKTEAEHEEVVEEELDESPAVEAPGDISETGADQADAAENDVAELDATEADSADEIVSNDVDQAEVAELDVTVGDAAVDEVEVDAAEADEPVDLEAPVVEKPANTGRKKAPSSSKKFTGDKQPEAEETAEPGVEASEGSAEEVVESENIIEIPIEELSVLQAESKTSVPVTTASIALPTLGSSPAVDAVTGEIGMINVATARAGMPFPTRRALREAEKRGVDAVVVGERRFETHTGQIPKVSIEGTEKVEELSWSELMERLGRTTSGETPGKDR